MPGVKVREREDGQTEYTFSQSWLNTVLGECSESARLELVGEIDSGPSDATAVGTAVHAGAELMLNGGTLGDAIEHAVATFDLETEDPNFRWLQTKTRDTAVGHVVLGVQTWHNKVFPQLGTPLGVELPYRLFLCHGGGWVAYLEGAIDFMDESGVWDWKTAGDDRKYKPGFGGEGWKLKRWSIQAACYTLAAYEGGFYETLPVPFTYAAITRGREDEVQFLNLDRGPADWDWLRAQVRSIVPMMQANLPTWPLNDQSALCSPKWCRAWETCKGAHLGADPW